MKEKNKAWTKWLYWFLFAVAVITVYKTLDNFTEITEWIKSLCSVLMPFILGILLAYIFYVPSRNLERTYKKIKIKFISKKARVLSIFSIYIMVLILLILIINFVMPPISQSITDLINNLPSFYKDVISYINNLPEDSILNKINVQDIITKLQSIDFSKMFNIETLTGYAKGILGLASGLLTFFITIIVSIYILIDRTNILNFFKKVSKVIFKEKTNKNLEIYFGKTNEIFFKFISSQVLDAIVVGVLTSIAMSILDVKYAILLGFMIGFSNLIPYFGAIVGVGIAILITVLTGGLTKAVWLALIVIILQQVDANIINPKIVGNSLKLSPLLVIFAVTVGGAYFGILGMFLAVPIVAVFKIVINDYLNMKLKEKENLV